MDEPPNAFCRTCGVRWRKSDLVVETLLPIYGCNEEGLLIDLCDPCITKIGPRPDPPAGPMMVHLEYSSDMLATLDGMVPPWRVGWIRFLHDLVPRMPHVVTHMVCWLYVGGERCGAWVHDQGQPVLRCAFGHVLEVRT